MKSLKYNISMEELMQEADDIRRRASKLSREEREELGRRGREIVEQGRQLWNQWLREEGRDLFDNWCVKKAKKNKK